MATNDLMQKELEQFCNDLKDSKLIIDVGIDKLENQKKDRDNRRKEIFLCELKKAISMQSDVDKNVSKELKSEAFDIIRSISKIKTEIDVLKESFQTSDRESVDLMKKLQNLKVKLKDLDVDNFVQILQVSVCPNPQSMTLAREKMTSAIFLQSPLLSANLLCLNLPSTLQSPNTISISPVQPGTVALSTLVLRRVLVHTSIVQECGSMTHLEECSVGDMMEKKTAWISGQGVTVRLRRPRDEQSVLRISVTVYGSNIVNSPGIVSEFGTPASRQIMDNTMADLTMSDLDLTSLPPTSVLHNPNISTLRKMAISTPAQLNNSTPFLPHSEGAVSTMRGTMSAHLSAAFSSVHTEVSDSILAPSTSGQLVGEMQASLSGSEAEPEERSVLLERSVSFAPATQVILPLSSDKMVRVEMGLTKCKDGIAGQVKRLERQVEYPTTHPTLTTLVPGYSSHNIHQSYSEPSGEISTCYKLGDDWSLSLSDKEGEVVSLLDDEVDALEIGDCEEQDYDPHLMLNASKAPAPGSSWPDDIPDWDTSLLPDNIASTLDQTLWEVEAQDPSNKFKFTLGSLEIAEVKSSQPVLINSEATLFCLTSPCCMTFLPSRSVCLVTEPQHNRVGVYEADGMQFKAWLKHPMKDGHSYNYPTAVLCLQNGFLWLVEKDRIQIFTKNVQAFQTIRGRFCGLVEGPDGEVFTLKQDKERRIFLKKFERKKSNIRAQYQFTGTIQLTVAQQFDNWDTLSKVRFLMYNLGRFYITDLGLHKMYILDMATGQQTATGYMGLKEGQIMRPTGLLADDYGNIMLADSENDRMVVFSKDGQFVKVIGQKVKLSAPHGLIRQGNTVLVVYMGREGHGCVVRYRIKQGEQSMGEGRKLLD